VGKLVQEKIPVKTKELLWVRTGDVYVLHDKATEKSYTLDAISFLVWIQCDGKTSLEKIVDVFAVNGNRDIVKAAIKGILEKLESNGLIKWV
jgi:hypothetical protein